MNYLINLDWLEFGASTSINLNLYSSSIGIYKISDVLILDKIKNYGLQKLNFNYCFKIFYLNDFVGFFYSKSLFNVNPGINSMVRIDNHVFYRKDFGFILKVIIDSLELTRTIIKRVDVCIDTDEDILNRFKNHFYNPKIQFRMRNKIKVNGTGISDEVLLVGSYKSKTKYISMYNKTKEINTSGKQYIRHNHFKAFGIKNIYRIELRIMNKLSDIKNIEIINLGKSEYLETIFNTYFDTLIHFIDIETKRKIEFISINNNGVLIKKVKKQKNFGGKKVKAIINFLDTEYKSKEFNGERKALKSIRTILLKKYGLETWYLTKKR